MRPARAIALFLLVWFLVSACARSRDQVVPVPSTSPSPEIHYRDPDCRGRVQTDVLWDFRGGVSPTIAALVREGVNDARKYFAFRSKNCESLRVSVTVTPEDHGMWVAEARYGTIYIWGGGPFWSQGELGFRYATLFHEWYHLIQEGLADLTLHFVPDWFVEGTAEWMGFRAAERFGHFSSFDVVRSFQREQALGMDVRLENLGRHLNERGAYAVAFMAIDHLRPNPRELLGFWRHVGSGAGWRGAFARAFGIKLDRFYERFARHRGAGYP
jgi:hypothetical protein